MKYLLIGLLTVAACFSGVCGELPAAEKTSEIVVKSRLPENYFRVSDDLARSGQPKRKEFSSLYDQGFRSVLNLRNHHSDADEIGDIPLKLYELPVNAGSLSEADILAALRIIREAPKPILVHCWHGSDRTGAVVAAYRIIFEKLPTEEAIDELVNGNFGHHRRIYRNIPRLLRSINWDEMREQVLPRE